MSLGLSHSLSRHKLKFSPDKVDTMIVQAISLLDDLDKELNTYAMRVKEWYGWHFPEMGKIVNDNLAYARVILKMGMRSNAVNSDFADILPEEIEAAVKAAAEISMGTEITPDDLENIQALAEQVVGFTEYRQQLSSYLSARMTSIAPNLTTLVGELVGARLIAHAGSLINLAKSPASTIQILGAEKALFRALKTKHDTPKYGLIYHASLIGQATGRNKGKIARMLATKAAIGLRVDALSDWGTTNEGDANEVPEEERAAISIESKIKIERRLRALEGRPLQPRGVAIGPGGKPGTQPGRWEIKEARKYNPDADGLAGDEPAAVATGIQNGRVGDQGASKPERRADVKMIEEIGGDEDLHTSEDEDEVMADGDVQEGPRGKANGETNVSDDEDDDEDGKEEEKDHDDDTDEDEDMEDAGAAPVVPPAAPTTAINGRRQKVEDARRDPSEEAKTKHSDESPTKAEKKIKKAARKAAQAAMLLEEEVLQEAKVATRLVRQGKKEKKRVRVISPMEEAEDAPMAEQVSLSISDYKQKLQQGEIIFKDDGTPVVLTKKELKQHRKALRMEDRKKSRRESKGVKGEKRKTQAEGASQGRHAAIEGSSAEQPATEASDRKRRKTERGFVNGGDTKDGDKDEPTEAPTKPAPPVAAVGEAVKGDEAASQKKEKKKEKKRKREEVADVQGAGKPTEESSGSKKTKKKKKKSKSKE